MPMKIPVTIPLLGAEEARAAAAAIRSGWVAQGPAVARFEQDFAAVVGARHACAVSSGTAALHLALLAVGVKPGDRVLTVSHSFIATANSVRHCGAEPFFVDIEHDTGNMSPAALERVLRKGVRRAAAVMPVHQVGLPCDIAAIVRIARRYRLPVVEDAACAIGSRVRRAGRLEPIGRPHGDAACFSFHPRKVITTGEGGMITTASAIHDRFFRLMRQHGMSVSDVARHRSKKVVIESYLLTGYNFRMTDIQAGVGSAQLARLPGILAGRKRLAALYNRLLADVPGVHTPAVPPFADPNWQSYVIQLSDPRQRLRLMQALQDRGIATRRGIMSSHLEPPYRKTWPKGCLPGSEAASAAGVILPIYPSMTATQVRQVVAAVRESLA